MPDNFVIEPYTIYRRGDIWIKHEFDDDNSEGSINPSYLTIFSYNAVVNELSPRYETYQTPKVVERQKHVLSNGQSYWSLTTVDHGWFGLRLNNGRNPRCLMEVIYDFANPGSGQLDIWINQIHTDTKKGPSSWSSSLPHKAINEFELKARHLNLGISDPPSQAEIDNVCLYQYSKINCEFSKYSPPRAKGNVKEVSTLRGYSHFQTTKYIGTEFEITLRFDSKEEHTDFILNIERPHVICDDKGIFYRGVVDLGEVKKIGNIYEQDISFRSPCKLGEGWI